MSHPNLRSRGGASSREVRVPLLSSIARPCSDTSGAAGGVDAYAATGSPPITHSAHADRSDLRKCSHALLIA
jgi:hypothetical protein